MPEPVADPHAWTITIDGEANSPLEITVGDLEGRFELVTRRPQMECAAMAGPT
jgi:DMSO/TMAO reductase YedYZ molybdopterin-dependent catalytic subunit